jgi:hypothetical protein
VLAAVNVPVGRTRKGVMRPTNTLTAPNQKLTSILAPESSAAQAEPVAKPVVRFVRMAATVIAALAPRDPFMNPCLSIEQLV